MYTVTYVLGTTDRSLAAAFWGILIECLIRVNMLILQAHPGIKTSGFSTLKTSGELRSLLQVVKEGAGSPWDLAAIDCAKARLAGVRGAFPRMMAPPEIPDRIPFFTGAFRGDFERTLSNAILAQLLEALTRMDVLIFEKYPNLPGIYQSGVFYKRELLGKEFWQTVLALYRQGFGDCEDLGCGLAGEKRVRERRPGVRAGFTWRKRLGGGTLYHIQQMNEAGRLEDDPSARLGMLEKTRCLAAKQR